MAADPRCWAVVPAAGSGKRMGESRPKQYLSLGGRPIIEHTLTRLRNHPRIAGVVVVISPGDPYWPTLPIHPAPARLLVAQGGRERCHSVLNGLERLADTAQAHDWVLVHDAARPLLRHRDIDRLIAELYEDTVGGLLGVQVTDTIKRSDRGGRVEATVDRSALWRALTPQMFRLGALGAALRAAIDRGALVTDEAQAMEIAGLSPRMVEGHADNIKITRPEDLPLAEYFLKQQAEAA
jgi:2-C-methyl-D-erythritol 4-phosphate cytidylyltransferase